jgi:histidine triad (HIT) family protein
MATIFSRIAMGEIPCYKVAENDEFFAFLDINPIQKGHTLVIPKEEVDYLFDIDDEKLGRMMVFAKQVAAQIKSKMGCRRVAVVVLGLEVPHAHIHLIPINEEKDVNFKVKQQLSEDEFKLIAEQIKL